jgi:predicted DNA-binding ribbon-helix-helix protein
MSSRVTHIQTFRPNSLLLNFGLRPEIDILPDTRRQPVARRSCTHYAVCMSPPSIMPPPSGFEGPVKRSITIAGHQTSISLEPLFWQALEDEARGRALPLSALVAQIDVLRIACDDPPNLASAIRTWLFACASSRKSANSSQ